jgi:peptidoglycan DL-endopeptidase CwlO
MARRVRLSFRVVGAGAVAASLTAAFVVAGGGPASAQSIKAQIASAQRQITELNSQAEAASERYNAARIKLATAQGSVATAQQALRQAQAAVVAKEKAVTAFAIAAYSGDTGDTLAQLTTGSTSVVLSRESSIQAVSTTQAQALTSIAAARRVEEQAQATATAALAAQAAATKAMADDRDQILAAAAKEKNILSGLQAKEAAIIKAAKARAARLAAEREAAALARQKAAAAAAAAAVQRQAVAPPPPAPAPQPAPRSTSHGSTNPPAAPQPVSSAGGAAVAVEWARREIGKPYVWGAAGPDSFDCSGLAQYVWAKAGVYLEHYTGSQWNEGPHIAQSDLEPGDLVFFAYNTSDPSTIHHVGIYVGGGMMIDAPYTGVDVREEPAFRSDYIGAVRP